MVVGTVRVDGKGGALGSSPPLEAHYRGSGQTCGSDQSGAASRRLLRTSKTSPPPGRFARREGLRWFGCRPRDVASTRACSTCERSQPRSPRLERAAWRRWRSAAGRWQGVPLPQTVWLQSCRGPPRRRADRRRRRCTGPVRRGHRGAASATPRTPKRRCQASAPLRRAAQTPSGRETVRQSVCCSCRR